MNANFTAIMLATAGALLLSAPAFAGNGAPSGAHYNLNIIGVPKDKKADMSGNNGGRIFVKLDGGTKILLQQSSGPGEYAVLDANGTDGEASFSLPNPDPDNDGKTVYSVYARTLGTPGGKATMYTCADGVGVNPDTGLQEYQTWCSLQWGETYEDIVVEFERNTGKSVFENVSKALLYVYADLDGNGTPERYPLFDSRLENYVWQYDNNGLKLVQLRFYEIPTDVGPWPPQ